MTADEKAVVRAGRKELKEHPENFTLWTEIRETKRGGLRPGAGRPKSGKPPRNSHNLKFTDQEWSDIQAGADRKGLSSREYISWLVEKDKKRALINGTP